MGAENSKKKKEKKLAIKNILKDKKKSNPIIDNKALYNIICPLCSRQYDSSKPERFNSHMKECAPLQLGKKGNIKPCDIYPVSFDYDLNEKILNNIKEYEKNEPNIFLDIRIEDKINELKMDLTEKKIQNEGTIRINLNRENLLRDTIKQTENVDLYKNWTIKFDAEEGIDAGGLMRDFFTNIFQILEGEQLKLFLPSESNDFSYILNPFLIENEENLKYCKLIGILLGKAILQNITINICFNQLIYKMILCEKIEFEDLMFIDSPLYKSLNNLKENIKYGGGDDMLKDLGLDYSIEMKDSNNHLHSFELIKNGRNTNVENLDDFIQKRINFLVGIYEPFIKKIRESFYKFIPVDKIKCLNSNELELLLNGRPFIDIEEWKSFTDYKEPYNENHVVIKWFWEILSELSQNELSNLLLFATGSSRVPLGGFIELESNNGVICRFRIDCIPYVKNSKNYIKSHTCFNRIDVPCFAKKDELKNAIKFITQNQIWGFGME